jgi:hypothetical protein
MLEIAEVEMEIGSVYSVWDPADSYLMISGKPGRQYLLLVLCSTDIA